VTAEELREFLRGRVAGWLLPERWAFIEAVPKTSVGKVDKKAGPGQPRRRCAGGPPGGLTRGTAARAGSGVWLGVRESVLRLPVR
jgi:hypothetical protein